MYKKRLKVVKRIIALSLITVFVSLSSIVQVFAAGSIIFHSGYEPGSTGVFVSGDPGAISDITGADTTFPSNNDWVNNLDNYSGFGNYIVQYETNDNSHQRYARLVNDPTNNVFEDSFDDGYNINNYPHYVSNDKGKRNWSAYTTANASLTIQSDPNNSSNQAMKILSNTAANYPKLVKCVDVSSSQSLMINYKVMTKSQYTYLDLELPDVSLSKAKIVLLNNNTATAGSGTIAIDPDRWADVSVYCDFYNNVYSVTVDGTKIVNNQTLFGAVQSDLDNVKVTFNAKLDAAEYYYLDDVVFKHTDTKFEDGFDVNYNVGDLPHKVVSDKGRNFWTDYLCTEGTMNVQLDPLNPSNKAMKMLNTRTTTNYLRMDKHLDASSSQKMTIDYKVLNLSKNTYVDIALPDPNINVSKTNVVKVNGSSAIVGSQTWTIDPNVWTAVSINCDLLNNTYVVTVNGHVFASETLFAAKQTDFRNVRIRFNSALAQNAFYYLDDVKITDSPNKVMKYFAGNVVNDGKLRIQSGLSSNTNKPTYYFKNRVYFNENFADLYSNLTGVTSYWLTLAEIFDGSCWNYDPNSGVPNITSRVSMGIAQPTSAGPLKFYVDHQQAEPNKPDFNPNSIWEATSAVDVPIGKWVTLEIYIKQGVGTNPLSGGGQFQMYMTGEDGVKQTVFDINNSTCHPNASLNGFESILFQKIYGNRKIFQNYFTANKDLMMYWDDFELWTDKP